MENMDLLGVEEHVAQDLEMGVKNSHCTSKPILQSCSKTHVHVLKFRFQTHGLLCSQPARNLRAIKLQFIIDDCEQ